MAEKDFTTNSAGNGEEQRPPEKEAENLSEKIKEMEERILKEQATGRGKAEQDPEDVLPTTLDEIKALTLALTDAEIDEWPEKSFKAFAFLLFEKAVDAVEAYDAIEAKREVKKA